MASAPLPHVRLTRRGVLRVTVALPCVALALGVSLLLRDEFGEPSVSLLVAAVLLSAWFGGPVAGLLALALALPGAAFFLSEPRYSFEVADGSDWLRLGVFAAVALLVVVADAVRRSREAGMRESADRLRVAMEAGRLGVWQWDLRTQRVQWSPSLEEIHGLAPGTFGGTFDHFLRDIHPDDRERVQEEITLSLERGRHEVEYRIVRPDGGVRWVLGSGRVLYDRSGEPAGMTGVCADVTERRQAADARRESEERFRIVADSAPVMVWMSDAQNLCTFFNRAWLEFTGRPLEEQLGTGWLASVHPEDMQREAAALVAAMQARQPFQVEYRLRRADGEYRWVLGRGAPRFTPGGEFAGYVGSTLDITERRREEESQRFLAETSAILASSLDYETTLERVARLAVPAIADMCFVTLDGEDDGALVPVAYAHVDPAKEELLKEAAAGPPSGLKQQHPVMLALRSGETQFIPAVPESLLASTALDDRQLELTRRLAPRSSIIVPLTVHGSRIGVVTLVMSESGREFAAGDVRVAEELARRAAFAIQNARLYRQSQEVQEQLRRANTAKDEFLGMVSHELRTPITTVYSGSRLLRLRMAALDEAEKEEILSDIEHEAQRLQLIVENLLALARAELPPSSEVEPMAIARVVDSVVRKVRKRRPGRDVLVKVQEKGIVVMGFPLYVELVLRNLLDNAEKYSPPDCPIEVVCRRDAGQALVLVLDCGPGIPENERERVFERFYRSEATSRKASGAGIGLSVCKALIEAQGGRIAARNRPEGGLEVTISLPLCAEADAVA